MIFGKPLPKLHYSHIMILMQTKSNYRYKNFSDDESVLGPQSDFVDPEEEDLWFLPGPDEEDPDEGYLSPLPRAPQSELPLVAPGNWEAAQAALATDLARLSMKLGVLDERLRSAPEGWRHRLAMIEAAELSWVAGERLSGDKLALWMALRLGAQEDTGPIARASWAARRLTGGPDPKVEGYSEMAAFLGRHGAGTNVPSAQDQPSETDHTFFANVVAEEKTVQVLRDELLTWCELVSQGEMHPITRAAYGFSLWGLSDTHATRPASALEAAVIAARLACRDCAGGAVFLPLAMGGAGALRSAGTPMDRLAQFYSGALKAVSFALYHLERITKWQERAEKYSATKSGKTPRQLIDLFAAWPTLSAPIAQSQSSSSAPSINRNITALYRARLIREMTGQTRYRFWTADV